MSTLYFVTGNKNKFFEVKSLLEDIAELKHFKTELTEIQADTLEKIAEYKVREAYSKLRQPVIVEDSGLFINSLNGFPGPYSKYVYKTIGNSGILKLMENIEDRGAIFRAVVAYYDGNILKSFVGEVYGTISKEERGKGGFGYDPIFIPEGYNITFAEDPILKNKISHRYRAFIKLKEWLKSRNTI